MAWVQKPVGAQILSMGNGAKQNLGHWAGDTEGWCWDKFQGWVRAQEPPRHRRVSRGVVGSVCQGIGMQGGGVPWGLGWRGQFMGCLWLCLWAERELLRALA